MEFTVTIHQQLLQQAMKETGIRDASKLMTHALKSRVLRGAAHRLTDAGGSDPEATAARRSRIEELITTIIMAGSVGRGIRLT